MVELPKLKICVVTGQLGKVLSGPGIHAQNLIAHLVRDGHEVVAISLTTQQPDVPSGFRFVGVNRPVFASSQARWMSMSLQFARCLQRLEKEERFDLVHFTDARDSFFCRTHSPRIGNVNDTYAAELRPLTFYLSNYNDGLLRWGYYHWVHGFERTFLPKLDAIIANSRYTEDVLKRQYPAASPKVFMIYKSIEASHFKDVLQARQLQAHDRSLILMVGSNLQRKGIRILIRAAPQVIAAFPDAAFVIAGSDPAIPALEKLCRERGVQKSFQFLGGQSRKQLAALYQQATLLVLPALTEALGIVLLEAMACGVPVIASRVGGIPEIVQDGQNGLLCPAQDARALADAITTLIQRKDLQEKFVRNGYETVNQFSVEKMMTETYQLYQHVLDAQRGRQAL